MCNANRLEQVLVNLISNAADAVEAAEGGAVMVTLRSDDAAAFIEVHDNGPGLDATLPRRTCSSRSSPRKDQGTGLGLGLAISNDIVRHFGGSLSADRSGLLGGARFVVQLRLALQHATID